MKVSICTIIKDENLFLKEWIDYHMSIGVDNFYLCEDIGSTSHKDITDQYNNVTLIPYSKRKMERKKFSNWQWSHRQSYFYGYALDKWHNDTDWIAFIDVDEFIHIDNNINIKEFLKDYENFESVYLFWKFYGAAGHVERPQGNVQDIYTEVPHIKLGWVFKSIVNTNKLPVIPVNNIHIIGEGVNTLGFKTHLARCFAKAHIKHYFTKSWEDWITRFISKGDVLPGNRKFNQFFLCNQDMIPQKEELMEFYEQKLKENKSRI